MYMDIFCFNYFVMEVVDNSFDEVMVGYVDMVEIIISEDQYIIILDNGCGIFVDIYFQEKMFGVEVIFDKFYLGGKFSNKNY